MLRISASPAAQEGRLLVLSGIRGAGKSFLTDYLVAKLGFTHAPSVTTRAPRPGERPGVDRVFVAHNEFFSLRSATRLIGVTETLGDWYANDLHLIDQYKDGKRVVCQSSYKVVPELRSSLGSCYCVYVWPAPLSSAFEYLKNRCRTSEEMGWQVLEACRELGFVANERISSGLLFDYHFVNRYCQRSVEEFAELIRSTVDVNQGQEYCLKD